MNEETKIETHEMIEKLMASNGKYVFDQYGCGVPQKMFFEEEVKDMLYQVEMAGFFRAQKFYERRNED